MHDEFKDLYNSLFEEARNHIEIIKVLANKPGGHTRSEIIETTGLTSNKPHTQAGAYQILHPVWKKIIRPLNHPKDLGPEEQDKGADIYPNVMQMAGQAVAAYGLAYLTPLPINFKCIN